MVDVQIVGHVCVDLSPVMHGRLDTTPGALAEVGPMNISVGGAVGNGLRAAVAMGCSAAASASVGADELGSLCRSLLALQCPDALVTLSESLVRATSYSVVVQPPGEDRSFWHHTGANDEFDGSCPLVPATFVHFGYPTLVPTMTSGEGAPTVELFSRAHQQGSATSLDLAYCADNSPLRTYNWNRYFHNVLPVTDVFCPSWEDITSACRLPSTFDRQQAESAAEEFLVMGAAVVLITAGELGAYVATGNVDRMSRLAQTIGADVQKWADVRQWVSAAPVDKFVSSNGAGDTFKVAFLVSALNSPDPVSAARRAAGVVARHISGLPLVEMST